MRPAMIRQAFAATLVALAGCKETGESGEGGKAGEIPALTAPEFYNDYSALKGADLLKKYKDGVIVTGQVKKLVDLGKDEGLQVWLTVEGPGHIAARFQDGGDAARKQKLKAGDDIKLRCQISGKPDTVLFVGNCTLEPPPPT